MACGKTDIFIGVDLQGGINDTVASGQEGLNVAADVPNCISRLTLNSVQVTSYILSIVFKFHVEATHQP